MTDEVAEVLQTQLKTQGSELAHVEDSAKCVLRIAADRSINGKSVRASWLF